MVICSLYEQYFLASSKENYVVMKNNQELAKLWFHMCYECWINCTIELL